MDCNEARLLLDARLDRELSAGEARHIEQHLTACAQCRREAQALLAVSRATRAAEYFRAPAALRARLVAALPPAEPDPSAARDDATVAATATPPIQPPTQPSRAGETVSPGARPPEASRPQVRAERPGQSERPRARAFGWAWDAWRTPRGVRSGVATLGWPAGVALAAVALALSAALVLHRPGSDGAPFVDELVASHVRAQMSGRDIDVVSSDQHTVKPWFNGRLDYAPPVEDLADDGFALTGGRLDYIGHRRVAVLVYRYRKHIVDVYVMPDADAAARQAPTALTSDGYALASWRDRGMTWWAVSDAEPAVLNALHSALAARLDRAPARAASAVQ